MRLPLIVLSLVLALFPIGTLSAQDQRDHRTVVVDLRRAEIREQELPRRLLLFHQSLALLISWSGLSIPPSISRLLHPVALPTLGIELQSGQPEPQRAADLRLAAFGKNNTGHTSRSTDRRCQSYPYCKDRHNPRSRCTFRGPMRHQWLSTATSRRSSFACKLEAARSSRNAHGSTK